MPRANRRAAAPAISQRRPARLAGTGRGGCAGAGGAAEFDAFAHGGPAGGLPVGAAALVSGASAAVVPGGAGAVPAVAPRAVAAAAALASAVGAALAPAVGAAAALAVPVGAAA
ncbi:MAG: hypothetical protein D6689_17475, partial [Deltaproteobacteria bacterium]